MADPFTMATAAKYALPALGSIAGGLGGQKKSYLEKLYEGETGANAEQLRRNIGTANTDPFAFTAHATPNEVTAYNYAEQLPNNYDMGVGHGIAQDVGQNFELQKIKGADLSGYMNPYLDQVLTPTLRELQNQYQMNQSATNAAMTKAGNFGGSAQALNNAQVTQDYLTNVSDTTGRANYDAYNQAINNLSLDNQFTTQEAATRLNASDAMGLAALRKNERDTGILNGLLSVGGYERDYNQGVLDTPFKLMQQQQQTLAGVPSYQPTQESNRIAGMLQGGIGAASIGNQFGLYKKNS